jgi:hypothetical protein
MPNFQRENQLELKLGNDPLMKRSKDFDIKLKSKTHSICPNSTHS